MVGDDAVRSVLEASVLGTELACFDDIGGETSGFNPVSSGSRRFREGFDTGGAH
jgi:hypothetical protein